MSNWLRTPIKPPEQAHGQTVINPVADALITIIGKAGDDLIPAVDRALHQRINEPSARDQDCGLPAKPKANAFIAKPQRIGGARRYLTIIAGLDDDAGLSQRLKKDAFADGEPANSTD
jgi:hypothetical protein